jgi:hypothetical protein
MVFSRPPSGVSDEEFIAWYDGHLPEILRIPGFVAAQAFRLEEFITHPDHPVPFSFMTAYEFHGTAEEAMAGIAGLRTSGGMDLPDWFDRFEDERCLISWNCIPVTARARER